MRKLGLLLGLLIVLSASVQLAVIVWHMATRGHTGGGTVTATYLLALVVPALVMLVVGVLVAKACWPRSREIQREVSSADEG